MPRLALLLVLAVAPLARAQEADTSAVALPEIRIEAARGTATPADAPLSVALLSRQPDAVALQPALSLDEVLRLLPGLYVSDRAHFALGERLLIRGMGARAAFGVRGVQVVLDGVPLTLPDGQTAADVVEPSLLRSAELLRGPASLFWGNGSGGVLFLSTRSGDVLPLLRARALAGTYAERQLTAEAGASAGEHRLQAFVADVRRDGYRDHSAGRFTRAGLHGALRLSPRTRLDLTAALADQDVDHPGSLTAAQVGQDPAQADVRYVNTRSGKQSLQTQGAARLRHLTGAGLLTATAYAVGRTLDNPLPFAYIDVDRLAGGGRLTLNAAAGPFDLDFGIDAAWQRDDRANFDNENGRPDGPASLDQRETVAALAAFAGAGLDLTPALRLTAGLRADRVAFAMDDRLLADGDASGDRTFLALSPAVGLAYRMGGVLLFADYGSAFETPTTTELVNRPDLTGGFNPDLQPQRTHGLEAGLRGAWPSARLVVDAAAFLLLVRDRLVPFQTPDGEGRTFYRNAGENRHAGVELALSYLPSPFLRVELTYQGGRFVFLEDPLDGNRLPGVPDHRAVARLRLERAGWWGEVEGEASSDVFVDDANTERADGYGLLHLRLGHADVGVGGQRLQPFVEVRNVFDRAYVTSVIINASGGRYYEPGPGRAFRAGVNVRL